MAFILIPALISLIEHVIMATKKFSIRWLVSTKLGVLLIDNTCDHHLITEIKIVKPSLIRFQTAAPQVAENSNIKLEMLPSTNSPYPKG